MTKLEERAEKIRKLRGRSSGQRVRRCTVGESRRGVPAPERALQVKVDENLGPSVGDE